MNFPLQTFIGNCSIFIGVLLASMFIALVEYSDSNNIDHNFSDFDQLGNQIVHEPVSINALSEADIIASTIAWEYFKRNTNTTGLVNSVDGFPSTTMWDQASYLLGLISAHRLGIVSNEEFHERADKALNALLKIPLFQNILPNKVYNTKTLKMTNYENQDVIGGVGWSAIDVARIAVPLKVLMYDYPRYTKVVGAILARWRLDLLVQKGVMYGGRLHIDSGELEFVQEGRLGYEEYSARALALLGLDTGRALRIGDYLSFENVSGVDVATDSRSPEVLDANSFVVSEPYILTAIEFGLDEDSKVLADRVYRAQEARYLNTGIPTAVSEDNLDRPPYFIYNSVFGNGSPWAALSHDGKPIDELRLISAKTVFGWNVLYNTHYTNMLRELINEASAPGIGWNAGIYEYNFELNEVATANTNGIILQSIAYKKFGPILHFRYFQ